MLWKQELQPHLSKTSGHGSITSHSSRCSFRISVCSLQTGNPLLAIMDQRNNLILIHRRLIAYFQIALQANTGSPRSQQMSLQKEPANLQISSQSRRWKRMPHLNVSSKRKLFPGYQICQFSLTSSRNTLAKMVPLSPKVGPDWQHFAV
jgi:hypothetical protein